MELMYGNAIMRTWVVFVCEQWAASEEDDLKGLLVNRGQLSGHRALLGGYMGVIMAVVKWCWKWNRGWM